MRRGKNWAKNGSGNSPAASAKSKVDTFAARPPSLHSPRRGRFSLNLSILFLLLSFATSAVIAFFIGWLARLVLLTHLGLNPYSRGSVDEPSTTVALYYPSAGGTGGMSGGMSNKKLLGFESTAMSGKKMSTQLPSPRVIEGKDVPFTTYASKTFQMAGVATSNTLHIDRTTALIMSKSRKEFDGGPDFTGGDGGHEGGDEARTDGWVPCNDNACSRGKAREETNLNESDGHNDDFDGLHLPAGQHLLVDIKDVDSNFLNSEERLARAMIELINESKLTLLSYHCHSLVPIGVSCAGVLLESHVAFHTWPLEGVMTLDLFTCGGGLLIPTLPSIERLFGVPGTPVEGETEDDVPRPTMLWSHVLRGFREGFAPGYVRSKNPLDGSLGRYVLGKLDFDIKRPVLSTRTAVQSVNIYEVMEPKTRDVNSYIKSIFGNEGSYEAAHPQYFGPDKILFLDGVIQSTLYGDAAYHESIVHPAMITHASPKRVAIIGGGEGATLREVLKYRSVEEVIILEIDEELVEICAEYLPEWSDCADMEGSDVSSCFKDPRSRLVYVDAFKWFIDHFGQDDHEEEKFDVVIMDELDPHTSVEITGGLYGDTSFLDSLFRGLSEKGVFAVQLGKSKMRSDPSDEVGRFRDTAFMIEGLVQSGFESIHTYDEGHSHFYMPWSYLVAFKDYETRSGWHRTAPEIDIALQRRLHKTKSGKPALRYFDAPTMIGYQSPSKAQETTYCLREEDPYECDEFAGFDPDYVSVPSSDLKVAKSRVGEHAGRGLFAARDIPMEATIALDESWKAFLFPPLTWSVVSKMEKWAQEVHENIPSVEDEISSVSTFVEGYGHAAMLLGGIHYAIDSGVLLFINHGCNGTFNYGYIYEDDEDHENFTELSIDLNNSNLTEIADNLFNRAEGPYSPVFDRHWRHTLNTDDYALRDIRKGEELLTNYLSFVGVLEDFKEDLMSLRTQCSGEGVGDIAAYESESS